jgi:hypothetical protein
MSHKRGYARLATRYGDIRVYLTRGPAYRSAHAGYTLIVSVLRDAGLGGSSRAQSSSWVDLRFHGTFTSGLRVEADHDCMVPDESAESATI